MYTCGGKAEFSTSLLQSSVSHDLSEIILICWFDAQKYIFLIKYLSENLKLIKSDSKDIYNVAKYWYFK